MILKSFFALALTVSAFVSIAQDMDARTEVPAGCLSTPTALSADSELGFVFNIGMECPITNFVLTIKNSDGAVVFESKDPEANWDATAEAAGTYSWTLIGTMGSTVEYQHVKKLGSVTVVK